MEKSELVFIGFFLFILVVIILVTSSDLQRALLGALRMDGSGLAGNRAPELAGIRGYINKENVTIGENIGKKVILVDFWAYSCINCIRTLPFLRAWQAKYAEKGLLIIGVHTPEFDFEKYYGNVKKAVEANGLTYPVVLDNDYATWRAYGNHYWPAKYLIDRNGKIVYTHFGEGNYEETEDKIRELLADLNGAPIESDSSATQGLETVDYRGIGTPELYFGYNFRRAPLGNQPVVMEIGGEYEFKLPEKLEPNIPYLEGRWADLGDSLELAGDEGRIVIYYRAKDVNLVAGMAGAYPEANIGVGGKLSALIDGKNAGTSDISGYGLYRVVRGANYAEHRLELVITGKNVRIYAFTFG